LMLGVWVQAQGAYTDTVDKRSEDSRTNRAEMDKAIEMAKVYPDIIKVIAVGNEAMVDWQEHDLPIRFILGYVKELQGLKAAGDISNKIWITSSDNYAVWAGTDGNATKQLTCLNALIGAVDYISLHSYPFHDSYYANSFWLIPEAEQTLSAREQVDAAMLRSQWMILSQFKDAQDYILGLGINKPIHIGETGWASEGNVNYGKAGSKAADEYKQKINYALLHSWATDFGASVFFFQAFDEPWKGGADNPGDSEKHFGLINKDGEAKFLLWDRVDSGTFKGLKRGGVPITKTFIGVEKSVLALSKAPGYQ